MIGHGGLFSILLHSPDKGFWACLRDLLPDSADAWVLQCILMLKQCGLPSDRIVPRATMVEGNDSSHVRELISNTILLVVQDYYVHMSG